jgi:hypothetical protein
MTEASSRLKKVGTEERTYEVFEFEFADEADRNDYFANPLEYVTRLFAAQGIPVRQLLVEAGVQASTAPMKSAMYHQILPPEKESGFLIVLES